MYEASGQLYFWTSQPKYLTWFLSTLRKFRYSRSGVTASESGQHSDVFPNRTSGSNFPGICCFPGNVVVGIASWEGPCKFARNAPNPAPERISSGPWT